MTGRGGSGSGLTDDGRADRRLGLPDTADLTYNLHSPGPDDALCRRGEHLEALVLFGAQIVPESDE